jgi:hypothetical protein
MPSTPNARDRGRPEKHGIIYGFFSYSQVPGLSAFTTVLVCHPKCPTTWVPTLYSGWRLSTTLKTDEVHTR